MLLHVVKSSGPVQDLFGLGSGFQRFSSSVSVSVSVSGSDRGRGRVLIATPSEQRIMAQSYEYPESNGLSEMDREYFR